MKVGTLGRHDQKLVNGDIGQLCRVSEPVTDINLDHVMSYRFDPLVHRMMDKYKWGESEAQEAFEDLKRYLWLCAVTGKPLVPSVRIDELWHNFILFTMDYAEFCQAKLGRFMHHRPRRRDDKDELGHSSPVGVTICLATEAFGQLSKNWEFPGVTAEAGCSCSNWCRCS